MIFVLIVLASIMLGLSLITIGAYLWLAAKKMISGIVLIAVGLLLTSAPIAVIAFVTIATSTRG
jgi:hypothetical protein